MARRVQVRRLGSSTLQLLSADNMLSFTPADAGKPGGTCIACYLLDSMRNLLACTDIGHRLNSFILVHEVSRL
ncbi:hypothetical protein BJX68DRAFT_233818 [Aspergillus pseudodeflectus]|uniref:Uncharacterized protein n=1 Tax=Aspergillus pseudodeflectus TaxID=176178 RepID=A0ABR4KP53_9EURO